MKTSWLLVLGLVGAAAIPLSACGGDDNSGAPPVDTSDAGDESTDPFGTGNKKLESVTVQPATDSVEILNDTIVTKTFSAVAHYDNGTSMGLSSGVSWSADQPAVGAIDATGLYTPSAQQGGLVTVTASYMGIKGSGTLAVKLHYTQNPGNLSGAIQGKLKGASTPDAKVVWAYPYDKTVFPRGLGSTPLMWNGSAMGDAYYIHLVSPYYELETFTLADPPSQFALAQTDWAKFVDSTVGKSDVFVNRWDGMNATNVIHHTWTIAGASMRGTIYYWANNLGRVMRIKPGATAPDDFANQPPLNDPSKYTQTSCLMTCHTVSADGSTLVSGGGTYGGSFDLKGGKAMVYTGGTWGVGANEWQSVQWSNSAVSPNGQYMMTNSMAVGLSVAVGGPTGFQSLYDTTAGTKVPNSGLDGLFLAMPAWSPEGSLIAYVDSGNPSTWSQGWNIPAPGNLRIIPFNAKSSPMASAPSDIVQVGSDPNMRINWPTVSPDGKWVVYGRGATADTRYSNSDLYMASTTTPNAEARGAQVDGDGYPFAAGTRDLSWNFEPAFAPVASGGYFWVVFTSRRTYGNVLTGAKDVTKQLWVAAIDQNPKLNTDGTHPAFRLPGQAPDSINMRGYWALDPCKPDGSSCSSGTECCGGYCDPSPDGGAPVCGPKQGCSNDGDHCDSAADCCGASSGEVCINHVCSAATPN